MIEPDVSLAEQVAEGLLRHERALADADEAARDRATPGELHDFAPRPACTCAAASRCSSLTQWATSSAAARSTLAPPIFVSRKRAKVVGLAAENRRQRPPRQSVEAREAAARLLQRHAAPHGRDLALRAGQRRDPARDRPIGDRERRGEDRREQCGSGGGSEGGERGSSAAAPDPAQRQPERSRRLSSAKTPA